MPSSLNVKARSSALWSVLGKGSATLGNFVIGILLARLLSVEDFGIFMLLMSLVTTAAVVAQFGLPMAAVRLVSGRLAVGDQAGARRMGASFWFLGAAGAILVASLFACCLHLLIADAFSLPNIQSLRWLMALWIAMLVMQAVGGETFRGMHRLGFATGFGGALFLVVLVPLLAATLWRGGAMNLEIAVGLTIAILALNNIVASIVAGKVINSKPTLSREEFRDIAFLAASFSVSTTAIFVVSQADIWSLGYFFQGEQVGYYSAAVKLAGLVLVPLLVVNTAVMHLVPELHGSDRRRELSRLVRGGAGVALLLSTPVVLAFVLYGDIVMALVYGNVFTAGGRILSILALAHLVNVWTGPSGLTLMLTGGQWDMVKISLATGTMVFAGVFMVAPVAGPEGVALVVAGGVLLQNGLSLFSVHRRLGIWTIASLRDASSFIVPQSSAS